MKIFIIFSLILLQILSRKLVFVQNLFRHGARYPVFINGDDFTNEPRIANNKGQLTSQGKNMHYMLGKILYKKYWKALFEGTQAMTKIDPKLVYFKSTNVNRTIESAQSQLRGWVQNLPSLKLEPQNLNFSLPAFQNMQNYLDLNYTNSSWEIFNEMPKFHPVPIHTGLGGEGISSSNPYDQGEFLVKFDEVNCPKQYQWQEQNFNSQMGQYIQNLPRVKQALRKLQQSFPSLNITFKNAYKVIDNYVCMQHLGEPTLAIFSDSNYEKVFRYIKEVSMYINLFYQPIQYQTTATALFKNIVNNIKNAVNQTGPKLILYSAHDTTLGMTLAAMNLTNVNCINDKYLKDMANEQTCVSDYPRFSANFIIEVYKQDNNTYSFDIVFNNIHRRIPFCEGQFSCPVQKLYQWYDSWKVEDPNKECGIEDSYKTQLKNQKKSKAKLFIVIAVLTLIVIVMGIWMIYSYCEKKQQEQQKKGYMQKFEEKDWAEKDHPMQQIVVK